MEIDAAAPLLLHFDLPNRIDINADRGDFVLTFGSVTQTEQLDLSALLRREPAPFSPWTRRRRISTCWPAAAA